ncbi:tyrosinase family oxidase copper chaperone [Streptomyces sp. NBC_00820]|uniref:tyrosinase family oxidase copper chaperone n=1 Tax=Streptomyces sp. NBC_00820 TaxID=2975842 RepID=UPI003FA72403
MARGLLASAAALALAPVVAASRPVPPAHGPGGRSFDETYRGRRIQGFLVPVTGRRATGDEWQITVDGHPLHLMRRADGTWMSMVDHYTSYKTPLEATRAAVDELGPTQQLREVAPGPLDGDRMGTMDHMGDMGHSVRMDGMDGMDRMAHTGYTGHIGGGRGVRA